MTFTQLSPGMRGSSQVGHGWAAGTGPAGEERVASAGDLGQHTSKIIGNSGGTTRNSSTRRRRPARRAWHVAVAVVLMAGALGTGAAAVTATAVWFARRALAEQTAPALLVVALLLLYPVSQAVIGRLVRRRPARAASAPRRPRCGPARWLRATAPRTG